MWHRVSSLSTFCVNSTEFKRGKEEHRQRTESAESSWWPSVFSRATSIKHHPRLMLSFFHVPSLNIHPTAFLCGKKSCRRCHRRSGADFSTLMTAFERHVSEHLFATLSLIPTPYLHRTLPCSCGNVSR